MDKEDFLNSDLPERFIVKAAGLLLKDWEGIVVELNGLRMIVWKDPTDRSIKLTEVENDDKVYSEGSMLSSDEMPNDTLKDGTLLWMHPETVQ